jgi:hypothetical protein
MNRKNRNNNIAGDKYRNIASLNGYSMDGSQAIEDGQFSPVGILRVQFLKDSWPI